MDELALLLHPRILKLMLPANLNLQEAMKKLSSMYVRLLSIELRHRGQDFTRIILKIIKTYDKYFDLLNYRHLSMWIQTLNFSNLNAMSKMVLRDFLKETPVGEIKLY